MCFHLCFVSGAFTGLLHVHVTCFYREVFLRNQNPNWMKKILEYIRMPVKLNNVIVELTLNI